MEYNESGWLFQDGTLQNITRDVSQQDLMDLCKLADEDDAWNDRVEKELVEHERNPSGNGVDILLDEFRAINVGGTVVQQPYGYMITFPSKQHLFRGENKLRSESIPSLNRKLKSMPAAEKELYRTVSNMRIEQFRKFLWQFHITPYWEAKLCDVNYKALAQHYGFETHLLDLTNDFRSALFFATCRYDSERDCYFPLTEEEIEKSDASKYGVIFHTPDWQLDVMQPFPALQIGMRLMPNFPTSPIPIDSGLLDGAAFQIGFQPLQRCHCQSGYLLPMREDQPLQADCRFEKLRFRQSADFSQRIFDWMDGGKKVFPNEGISRARKFLSAMQTSVTFSEDDLSTAYVTSGVDKGLFPTVNTLRETLQTLHLKEGTISIVPGEIDYHIPETLIDEINAEYDVDLLQMIGGTIRRKPEERAYREQRCIEIYGKLI